MKFSAYVADALLTEADPSVIFPNLIVSKSDNPDWSIIQPNRSVIRLLHGTIGMTDEFGEKLEAYELADYRRKKLDKVNFVEELGDFAWYMAITWDCVRELFPDAEAYVAGVCAHEKRRAKATSFKETLLSLGKQACLLSGVAKKAVFYGKEIGDLSTAVDELYETFLQLCDIMDIPVEMVYSTNIEKLQKVRYKLGKFTAEEAKNRDTGAERESLEAGVGGKK